MMDCVIDFDECDCSCHNGDMLIMHCSACCEECPNCFRRILIWALSRHKQDCGDQEDD